MLIDYLGKGGRVFLVTNCADSDMPNMARVTATYGMERVPGIVVEGNPGYYMPQYGPTVLVYDYEPHVALFGGEDGLKFYREIFENAAKILNDKALAFFEMGYDQKENLSKLAREYFDDVDIRVYKDINGKDRMLMLKFF